MLQDIITSKTRIKLLMRFFLNSSSTAYLRELATEFGVSTNGIREELKQMVDSQLMKCRKDGRHILYQANEDHPLFPELRSMVQKSLGMDQVLFPMVQIESPDAAKLKALIAQIAFPMYPVYIHCAEGKDRTGAICGCIRATEGWDYSTEILPEMYSYGHNPIFEPMRGTIQWFIKESAK